MKHLLVILGLLLAGQAAGQTSITAIPSSAANANQRALAYEEGVGTRMVSVTSILDYVEANGAFTGSQISDFGETVDDQVNGLLVGGDNISLTYDDGADTLTIDGSGGAFAVSGTNAYYLSGNVGVGTDNPQQLGHFMLDGVTDQPVLRLENGQSRFLDFRLPNPADTGSPFTISSDNGLAFSNPDNSSAANLMQDSEELGGSNWVTLNGADINTDTLLAPDGLTTADSISSTGSAAGGVYQTGVSVSGSTTYTFSVYIKHVSGTASDGWLMGIEQAIFSSTPLTLKFNPSDNTFTPLSIAGGVDSYSSEYVGNGWYRVEFTGTTDSSIGGTATAVIYSGNSESREAAIWGVQFEANSEATPYIGGTQTAVMEIGAQENVTVFNDLDVNGTISTTELVVNGVSVTGGGTGDDLGSHTASQTLNLNGNWLSGDGGAEGLQVLADGTVSASGIVSATAFYGDGSNLTGISGGGGSSLPITVATVSSTWTKSTGAGWKTIELDETLLDAGSDFNTSTHKYVVPEDGTYKISYVIPASGPKGSDDSIAIKAYRTGSTTSDQSTYHYLDDHSVGDYVHLQSIILMDGMVAGDEIEMQANYTQDFDFYNDINNQTLFIFEKIGD